MDGAIPTSCVGHDREVQREARVEVGVYSGKAGQTAAADVDRAGRVVKAWVGPEVAWPLARGEGSEARSTGRSSGWRSASSS